MALKVYYDLMSQPCRALLIFLKVNNIPFESVVVDCGKGEHLIEAFSKINPLKRIPVIDHNGFILTESIAMVRYLSREYEILDDWYPKDSKKQARVDEYLEWQHLNLRYSGSMIFRESTTYFIPLKIEKPNEENLKHYKSSFRKNLKDIEKSFLRYKNYLCDETMSAADIFCACEIEQGLVMGFEPFSEMPLMEAWLDRVKQELDPHYSEVHGAVKKLLNRKL